jgi:hypothetical protein
VCHGQLNTENKLLTGFASVDISDGIGWKFRVAKLAPTFKAATPIIGETAELIEKKRSLQLIT